MILSVERYEDGTDRRRYAAELDAISERLRSGDEAEYDEAEIAKWTEIYRLGQAMPWWVGLKAFAMVMLWLFPVWVIIALAIWLAWF